MWDSSAAGPAGKAATQSRSSAQLIDDGPTSGGRTAEMGLSGDSTGLTLIPDGDMLTSPQTVFPVVLDPAMATPTRSAWAAAWQLYPTTSFYKTTHSLGVGYEGFEQHKIVRSYFQFNISGLAGKRVFGARLRTYEVHSANCSARSVTVSRVNPITAATTWNNQPAWQADVTARSFAHGYSSACPAAHEEFTVTSSVAASTAKGNATTTFRLRATDETDEIAWKQFSSFGELEVNYYSAPIAPSSVGVADPNVGCDSGTDPVNIGDTSPRLRATPRLSTNDNGASVLAEFAIYDSSGLIRTVRSSSNSPGIPLYVTLTPLADQKIYYFRARTIYVNTGVGEAGSAWSGLCYFRTDTTAPNPPKVTAKYGNIALPDNCSTSTGCAEIAPFDAPVTFTIQAMSGDVVRHTYRFQNNYGAGSVAGLNVTKALEPPQEGLNTLFVRSYDESGHYSRETAFVLNVKASSGPVGSWAFNERSGTSAGDGSGKGHPLVLGGGAKFDEHGRVGGSLVLDGIDDQAQASTTVVDTSQSFSASAWVRLTDATKQGVVVAAVGSVGSAFELYFDPGINRWVFLRMAADSSAPTLYRAVSADGPVWGAWTQLTVVYDSARQRMQMYVNGRLQTGTGDVAYPASGAWKAGGPLMVGRGKYGGSLVAPFDGSIDGVHVWQRALRATEIDDLADPRVAEVVQAGLAAHWPFEYAYLGSDSVWRLPETVYEANMPLSGFGASTDQSSAVVEDDERGKVLQLSGVAGESVSLGRPVVDATTSFTVAVWVKVSDTSRPMVIARQADATKDAWRLEYRPVDSVTGEWVFARTRADSATEDVAVYPTDRDAASSEWKLLIATYDAAAASLITGGTPGEIRLTVNAAPWDGAEKAFTVPYRFGATVVGKGRTAGREMAGRIDDLRLYAGALSESSVCREFPDLGDQICGTPAS